MAKEVHTIAELFGPPPTTDQINLMEPPVCPIDGGACTCQRRARVLIIKALEPTEEQKKQDEDYKRAKQMKWTQNPKSILANRAAWKKTAPMFGCPREPKMH